MSDNNKRANSRLKLSLKFWLLLLIVAIAFIWLIPQRTLKIQINTASNIEQFFYVVTKAGKKQHWHGYPSFKLADKRLISSNKVHRIHTSRNLRPWYDDEKMYVTVKHPEYREVKLVEEGYRGKLLTVAPQSWLQVLQNKPSIEFIYPELAYQPYDYKEQKTLGKILNIGEIRQHLHWVANDYHDLKSESLPVLHKLAGYVITRSVRLARFEKKLIKDDLRRIKKSMVLIEERLVAPVGK